MVVFSTPSALAKVAQCDQDKVVQVLPAKDKPDDQNRKEEIHSYQLMNSELKKFKELPSYYAPGRGSFTLMKTFPQVCLAHFKYSTNWEGGDERLYDLISEKEHVVEAGGNFAISKDAKSFAVWNCHASVIQSDFGKCSVRAKLKIYSTVEGGRKEIASLPVVDLLKPLKAEAAYKQLPGSKRIHLTSLGTPFDFEVKLISNEMDDDNCYEGNGCKPKTIPLGKIRVKSGKGSPSVEVIETTR